MRSALSKRVARLEREAGARSACPVCAGRGVAAVRWTGEKPPNVEDNTAGCRACGRLSGTEVVVSFGGRDRGWWNARDEGGAEPMRT